jgi:hypothetical protein
MIRRDVRAAAGFDDLEPDLLAGSVNVEDAVLNRIPGHRPSSSG